jgi:uncharacterized protein
MESRHATVGDMPLSLPDLALLDFTPRRPWWGGDLQTLRNYLLSALPTLRGETGAHLLVAVDDGDRLVVALDRPARPRRRPLVVLVHGLAGCESSCYMILAAAFFLERGHAVARVNLRGAGPSRPYCRQQYHAARTGDLRAVLAALPTELRRHGMVAVGFSLGGNLVLNLLAEDSAGLQAAATVSAPIDLALASRALLRWRNAIYHRYMLAHLKRNCTAKGAELEPRERRAILAARSLWAFDDGFTASRAGYADAGAFYEAASARARLGLIRTPTLLIHARDDPFVPVDAYDSIDWAASPDLVALLPRGGGHLGFHDPLGVWHLRQIASFFEGEGEAVAETGPVQPFALSLR